MKFLFIAECKSYFPDYSLGNSFHHIAEADTMEEAIKEFRRIYEDWEDVEKFGEYPINIYSDPNNSSVEILTVYPITESFTMPIEEWSEELIEAREAVDRAEKLALEKREYERLKEQFGDL